MLDLLQDDAGRFDGLERRLDHVDVFVVRVFRVGLVDGRVDLAVLGAGGGVGGGWGELHGELLEWRRRQRGSRVEGVEGRHFG